MPNLPFLPQSSAARSRAWGWSWNKGATGRDHAGVATKWSHPGVGCTPVRCSCLRSPTQETTSIQFEWGGTKRAREEKWANAQRYSGLAGENGSHHNNRAQEWRPLTFVTEEGTKPPGSWACLGSWTGAAPWFPWDSWPISHPYIIDMWITKSHYLR